MTSDTPKSKLADHLFEYRSVDKRRLILSLTITLTVMLLEILGGIFTNSIALISDAGHMFTHGFAIAISLFAVMISRKPPCHHKTFGMYRAEVLAAFINGLFLLVIVGFIIYESILRFLIPQDVEGFYMMMIAFIGLAVNITSILILRGSQNTNISVRSVFYHMIADAASSIGIVIVSIVILFTDFTFLDPIVSIFIAIIIFYWAWGILKESTRILLEIAPKGLNIDTISSDLKKEFPEILDLHNAHLWTIIPNMLVFSAYIRLNQNNLSIEHSDLLTKINEFLKNKYNIIESTLQLVLKDDPAFCNI